MRKQTILLVFALTAVLTLSAACGAGTDNTQPAYDTEIIADNQYYKVFQEESGVRIMDAAPPGGNSPGYPNGYIEYENNPLFGKPQSVDPITGRTLPNSQSHFPLE
jgi:hypothetical protein